MKYKTKAFTIVELIVVITILAVLATVAFISFQGYTQSAKDGKIATDTKMIDRALNYTFLQKNKYPKPDNAIDIQIGWQTAVFQWFLGKTAAGNIWVHGDVSDPEGNRYYYSTSANFLEYRIWYYITNENIVYFPQTQAIDKSEKKFKTLWHKLMIVFDDQNNILQDSFVWDSLDISNTTGETYEVYLNEWISTKLSSDDLKTIAYTSCKDIIDSDPSFAGQDGKYLISPDKKIAFEVYCDMTFDWGGWTYWKWGKIESETTDQEFKDYYNQVDKHMSDDFDDLYILPDEYINTVKFSESRTIMQWETGQYSNHLKYWEEISLLRDIKHLELDFYDQRNQMLLDLWSFTGTFNFSTTFSWAEYDSWWNFDYQCKFGNYSYSTSHLVCWEDFELVDTQHPFYQEYRMWYAKPWDLYNGRTGYDLLPGYWPHTCVRLMTAEWTQHSTRCNEENFSEWLFTNELKNWDSDTCRSDNLHWHVSVTNPSCKYRQRPGVWYEWRDWLR